MFDSSFPYMHYPYQILIRARTQAQFERAVSILACDIAATAVSKTVSEALAPTTAETAARVALAEKLNDEGREPAASKVMSALNVLADFDECGNGLFPWRWPRPPWQAFRSEPVPGKSDLTPWNNKPKPDPWEESGLFDVAILNAVSGLAQLAPDSCGALAETAQSLLKKFAG